MITDDVTDRTRYILRLLKHETKSTMTPDDEDDDDDGRHDASTISPSRHSQPMRTLAPRG